MELLVVGSGSAGNSYILQNENEALLLEAGVHFKKILKGLNYNVAKVAGCLVTHEHGDHAGHINEVLEAAIPVFASAGTIANIKIKGTRLPIVCEAGSLFKVGNFRVIPFGTRHDCAEPLGYFINHPETGNVLFATDTFYLPNTFDGLNNVLIECNYRLDLIDANTAAGTLPPFVRNRILTSHMSYDHCLEALRANDLTEVNNIVLIHLSAGNSSPGEFKEGIRAATGKNVHIAEAGLNINFNKTPF